MKYSIVILICCTILVSCKQDGKLQAVDKTMNERAYETIILDSYSDPRIGRLCVDTGLSLVQTFDSSVIGDIKIYHHGIPEQCGGCLPHYACSIDSDDSFFFPISLDRKLASMDDSTRINTKAIAWNVLSTAINLCVQKAGKDLSSNHQDSLAIAIFKESIGKSYNPNFLESETHLSLCNYKGVSIGLAKEDSNCNRYTVMVSNPSDYIDISW